MAAISCLSGGFSSTAVAFAYVAILLNVSATSPYEVVRLLGYPDVEGAGERDLLGMVAINAREKVG